MSTVKKKTRKVFGKLPFSVVAKNVPEGAVRANDALVERVARERAAGGWDPDANVAVPGPTRDSVMSRLRAEERAARRGTSSRRPPNYGEEA